MPPLITVLLSTYNGAKYISSAIASVLSQTEARLELIIINDASNDNTNRIAQELADNRVRIVHNETNIGLTKSLNRGLLLARGAYIARIDDDDRWIDTAKLARQMDFLKTHPEVHILGTAAHLIAEDGQLLREINYPTTDYELRTHMLQRNQFIHSSVLMRGSIMRKLGGYNEQLRRSQDYELWLRFGQQGKMANLPNSMVALRQRTGAISHQHHYQQFQSFAQSAYRYRRDYPGFYRNVPAYLLEAGLNSLPRSLYTRLQSAFK